MRAFCLISLALFITSIQAQKKLLGNYTQDFDYIAESDIHFEFFEDGSFIYEAWDDVGDYIGLGDYKLLNDSLFLYFLDIPEQSKRQQLIKKGRQDSLSRLIVYSTLNRREAIRVGFEIIEDEKQIERGTSDVFGKIYFSLKEGQYIRAMAYRLSSNSILHNTTEIKVDFENKNMDYIVFIPAVSYNTQFFEKKTKVYPIKVYRKGKYFGIEERCTWLWFEKQE